MTFCATMDVSKSKGDGSVGSTPSPPNHNTGGICIVANLDYTPAPCFVYFISAGSTPIKIGVANDPQSRLRDLQTAHYQRLHLLYTIECQTREQAYELENAFHRWYDDLQIRNEWFSLTPKQVTDDMRLLVGLAQAISVVRHTDDSTMLKMEKTASKKLNRVGTGELQNCISETPAGFVGSCPHCKFSTQPKGTYKAANTALSAHTKAHRKQAQLTE